LFFQVDVAHRLPNVGAQPALDPLGQRGRGAGYLEKLGYWRLQGAALAVLEVLSPGRIIDSQFHQNGAFLFRRLITKLDNLCRLVIVESGVLIQRNGYQNVGHLHALELIGGNHYVQ
jgi:hypothetical protein